MSNFPRVPSILQGIPDDLMSSDKAYTRRFKTDSRETSDHLIIEGGSFPSLALEDNGQTLEIMDTGDRYRWTGLGWLLTHLRGIEVPIDYFIEVASGHIPGISDAAQEGRSHNIGTDAYQTLWDLPFNKTYLSADTQLYITSTNDLDTAVIKFDGIGEDGDFMETEIALDGHTPVAMPDLMFRPREGKAEATLLGEVYLSEFGLYTDGVPDDPLLVQSKIPFEPDDSGDFASTHITHNGFFTVPAGFDVHLITIIQSAAKGAAITLDLRTRGVNRPWISKINTFAYSGPGPLTLFSKGRIGEMSDLEIRVKSDIPDGAFSGQIQFLLKAK